MAAMIPPIKGPELRDLRQRAEKYLARCQADGDRIITFKAPCCGKVQRTTAPKNRTDAWSTLCTCTACGNTFFKVVRYDRVETNFPQEE